MGSFTIALLQALVAVGVPHDRAREVVDLFDRSVDERYSLHAQILATKRDVAELQAQTAQRHGQIEARLAELQGRLETRIAEVHGQLEARIAATKADLIKWMLGALTAQTALLMGALKLL